MITLDEFNKFRWEHWNSTIDNNKNGISCPNCGDELYDTDPTTELLSFPPQKRIHCAKCDYKGLRYV
jgi:DNA-directed RNA polymerase subunit RPC12/RpoP